MIFHPARKGVAPRIEKTVPASPAVVIFAGAERATMKLEKTFETEIFINDGGLYITQTGELGDDDSIILLSREQAKLIAREIIRLDGDVKAWEKKADQ